MNMTLGQILQTYITQLAHTHPTSQINATQILRTTIISQADILTERVKKKTYKD